MVEERIVGNTILNINLVQIPMIVLWGLLSGYLVLLTIAASFYRRGKRSRSVARSQTRRFCIIVPAHNEELLIGQTLESLKALEYPADRYRVIVVADNCTDTTAAVAQHHGASVCERWEPDRRGKGAALNWIQARLANSTCDAFVYLDADSTVSPNMLSEMNRKLNEGHRVVQARYTITATSCSPLGQLTAIAFSLFNFVRPLGRSVLGASVGLRGNGMCFEASLLPMFQWNERSLVEDLDLGNRLLIHGIKVAFCPEAVVSSAMSNAERAATTQHARWERGRFASAASELPLLLRQLVASRRLVLLEPALDLVLPPLAIFGGLALAFFGMNILLLQLGIAENQSYIVAWGCVLGGIVVHAGLGSMIAGVHPKALLSFFYLPAYVVWKLGLYWGMIREKTPQEWIRTER